MAAEKIIHPETPAVFINQALTNPDPSWPWPDRIMSRAMLASAELVAEHKDRFWQDINVEDGALFPHICWQINEPSSITFQTPRGEDETRQVTTCYVYSRRKYPQGHGSFYQSYNAYKNMRIALLGIPFTPIKVGDVVIGNITQCRTIPRDGMWRRKYTSSPQGVVIVEYGLKLEIVYE